MSTHRGQMRSYTILALAQGWRVEKTGSGHIKFIPPDPSIPAYVTGSTPGDWRRSRHMRTELRRRGLVIP